MSEASYVPKKVGWAPKRIAPTVAPTAEAKPAEKQKRVAGIITAKDFNSPNTKIPPSDVVIIRKGADGKWTQRYAAPSFMRRTGFGRGEVKLPEGYYLVGTKAYQDRRCQAGFDMYCEYDTN